MFILGLETVAEMGKRGATIVPDAKIRSAPLSVDYVPDLMGKIIRMIIHFSLCLPVVD